MLGLIAFLISLAALIHSIVSYKKAEREFNDYAFQSMELQRLLTEINNALNEIESN